MPSHPPFRSAQGVFSTIALKVLVIAVCISFNSCAFAADKWEKSTSGNLTLVVDGNKSGETMKSLLNQAHVLDEIGLSLGNQRPIIIIYTTDSGEVSNAWPERAIAKGLGGVTYGFEDKIYVIVDRSKRGSAYALRHELVHALLREKYLHLPLWLDEGLADNLSNYRLDATQISLEDVSSRHRWRQGSCSVKLPFAQVLERNYQNSNYENGGGAVLHISALVVRYLIDEYGLTKVFNFLNASETSSQVDALRAVFGLSPEQLNDRAVEHCKLPHETKTFTHHSEGQDAYASISIDSDTAQSFYLEMLARVEGRAQQVIDSYSKYLVSHPGDAAANRGLGIAFTYLEKYPEAVRQFGLTGHTFDSDSTTLYLKAIACHYDSDCSRETSEQTSEQLASLRPDLAEAAPSAKEYIIDPEENSGLPPREDPDLPQPQRSIVVPEANLIGPGNTPASVTVWLIDGIKKGHERWERREPGFDEIPKDFDYTLNGKHVSRNSCVAYRRETGIQNWTVDEFEATPVGTFPTRFVVTYRVQTTFYNLRTKKPRLLSVFVKDTYDYINSEWKQTKLEAVTAK